MKIILILFSAILINNFVLTYFLGICPFLGVTNKIDKAVSMGLAVTFVMAVTAAITWPIYTFILLKYNLTFLNIIIFILVIAGLVQFVEMVIHKLSPALYQALGIYLPLITTNCAIMAIPFFFIKQDYTFIESVIFGVGSGLGFMLAMFIMAGMREQLDQADVPEAFKGVPLTLICAGILALAFMGFSGLIKV